MEAPGEVAHVLHLPDGCISFVKMCLPALCQTHACRINVLQGISHKVCAARDKNSSSKFFLLSFCSGKM